MKKYNLEFCFKGNRTYVQGPDIFDTVIKSIKNDFNLFKIKDIKYTAHNMLLSNADLYIIDNFNKNNFDNINSIITFKLDDIKYHAIVSQNDYIIDCSNEYSEEVVQTQSKIDGNIISFNNTLQDSVSEIIVSMNKYFLQETVTRNGKWIVTKFEYDKIIDSKNIKNKVISLDFKNNFNNKLTKSIIYIDGISVGFLYFSLI